MHIIRPHCSNPIEVVTVSPNRPQMSPSFDASSSLMGMLLKTAKARDPLPGHASPCLLWDGSAGCHEIGPSGSGKGGRCSSQEDLATQFNNSRARASS
jgi:hypothetical protein